MKKSVPWGPEPSQAGAGGSWQNLMFVWPASGSQHWSSGLSHTLSPGPEQNYGHHGKLL